MCLSEAVGGEMALFNKKREAEAQLSPDDVHEENEASERQQLTETAAGEGEGQATWPKASPEVLAERR
jgi:hypothetical protein